MAEFQPPSAQHRISLEETGEQDDPTVVRKYSNPSFHYNNMNVTSRLLVQSSPVRLAVFRLVSSPLSFDASVYFPAEAHYALQFRLSSGKMYRLSLL